MICQQALYAYIYIYMSIISTCKMLLHQITDPVTISRTQKIIHR